MTTMTVRDLFNDTRHKLEVKFSVSEAKEITLLIFEALKKWSLTDILIKENIETTPWLRERVSEVVSRVLDNEPIQYVLGQAHFYGMVFKVTPDVLIPRPETAELVDIIVDKYGSLSDLNVLDIATGSGCIAIALARNLRFASVDAFDISDAALGVARDNASALKANINFFKADILELDPSNNHQYDIIVSNPPYIALKEAEQMEPNVLDHEPASALFVPDNDPLIFYLPISLYALSAIKSGGCLFLEINPVYALMLKKVMLSHGWNDIEILRDLYGKERFIIARK